MKKKNIFLCVLAAVPLLFCGCQMLQDSLSDEMERNVMEDTGIASIDGSVWYYNGSSSSDMTSVGAETLAVEFGHDVEIGSSGVTATMEITYYNADNEKTVVTRSADADSSYLSTDGTVYNLSMSSVLALLDGAGKTTYDNTANVTLKLSGFVCASGDQEGRSVDTLTKTFSVQPLFASNFFESDTDISTLSSTQGRTITIPLNGEVSLSDDAFVDVESGYTSKDIDFGMSLSSDSKSIILTLNTELETVTTTAYVSISGIVVPGRSTELSKEFTVNFGTGLPTNKSWTFSSDLTELVSAEVLSSLGEISSLTITLSNADKGSYSGSESWWFTCASDTSWTNQFSLSWQSSGDYVYTIEESDLSVYISQGIYIAGLTGMTGTITVTYSR